MYPIVCKQIDFKTISAQVLAPQAKIPKLRKNQNVIVQFEGKFEVIITVLPHLCLNTLQS
jgi:hypothetical protein